MTTSWIELLDTTIQACTKYGRADLGNRLRDRRTQLLAPNLRVLVLGEQGQGKSQLINALVDAPVCAVGDGLTTRAPATVEHADTPRALIVGTEPGYSSLEGTAPSAPHSEVAIGSATAQANATAGESDQPVHTQLRIPAPLLRAGLVLVDTPGVGEANSTRTANMLSELLAADAVLLTSAATAEFSTSELELLSNVASVCPAVITVLTKIDLVAGWRDVLEANRDHLSRAGLDCTLVPVSNTTRISIAKSGAEDTEDESGFRELQRRLQQDWLGRAEQLGRRSVSTLSLMAIDQLLPPLRERLAEVRHDDGQDAKTRWRTASNELERVQHRSSHLQTRLSDEVTDLVADVEFDLRERTRTILQHAEEYFDVADPHRDWTEFERWLRQSLTEASEANFGWLLARFDWLARVLAYEADCAEQTLCQALFPEHSPSEPARDVRMPTTERFGISAKLWVGLRGSYGGVLMVGLITTVAGMDLINPISIAAGAAFGVKSVFEERSTRLQRRQAQAKSAAQRHVDDFFLTYNKESKEVARQLQRRLRDRLTEHTQQQRTDTAASVSRLKEIVDAESAHRTQQTRELKAGVDQLTALRSRIETVGNTRPSLTAAGRQAT